MAGNPRNGRPYRSLTARQRAKGLPCWWCGQPIDYTIVGLAAQRSAAAFTLDHELPLSRGGDLLDEANARSAHRRCNSARGNRLSAAPTKTSRRW
ncbi:HNH endonuclease [Streptomyces sp. NPDC088732]|uniref:HNH endonuclease n=1 Tax=Streptomyces sp. NPDC088732 TaxID=3365879 RepID=UPI003824E91B